jgi:hypothetical protein
MGGLATAQGAGCYCTSPTYSLLEHAIRTLRGTAVSNVKWVHDGQSLLVDGIEHGHHGFRGADGAKGSVAGFARIGRKISIGDKHSPEIMDAVYGRRHDGAPARLQQRTIELVYQNGKRALVTMQNAKWRA